MSYSIKIRFIVALLFMSVLGADAAPEETPLKNSQLASDVQWTSLNDYARERMLTLDHLIGLTHKALLSLPLNASKENTELRLFRENHQDINFILHPYNKRDPNLASVFNEAHAINGKITRLIPAKEIHINSFGPYEVNKSRNLNQKTKRLGYHAILRRGERGMMDVLIHEIAHLFNHTPAKGLTGKSFMRKEETRADYFLKFIRAELRKVSNQ